MIVELNFFSDDSEMTEYSVNFLAGVGEEVVVSLILAVVAVFTAVYMGICKVFSRGENQDQQDQQQENLGGKSFRIIKGD